MLQSKYFLSILFCCFLLTLFLFFALPANAEGKNQISSETLFEAFLSRLHPESMEMILDGTPDENGRVRRIYLDFEGCHVGNVRIERLQVDAIDVTFTPTSSWDEKGPGVEQALLVRTKTRVYEDDIDAALRSGSFGGVEEDWQDIKLRFRDGSVYVEGHKKVLILNIFFELQGQLSINHGREIWLTDYSMHINNSNAPKGLMESTVSKIQPLIDFGTFPFPLNLKRIIPEKNYMIFESRKSPQPFEGKSFRYKGSNNL